MADATKISWADATVNPVRGCTKCSPACEHCYAIRTVAWLARMHPDEPRFAGLVADGRWTGKLTLDDSALLKPLHWRKPRAIFWVSLGDLFHEQVPTEFIDRCFAVMALTPQHHHIVLTKRPERMVEYVSAKAAFPLSKSPETRIGLLAMEIARRPRRWTCATAVWAWPLPNVHLGISCWDQVSFYAAAGVLGRLKRRGWSTGVSLEPLLGPVFMGLCWGQPIEPDPDDPSHREDSPTGFIECYSGRHWTPISSGACLDWIIVGGESGPGARPMHPDWVRSIREQCAAAQVPFFFKQWGAWSPTWPQYQATSPAEGANGRNVKYMEGTATRRSSVSPSPRLRGLTCERITLRKLRPALSFERRRPRHPRSRRPAACRTRRVCVCRRIQA